MSTNEVLHHLAEIGRGAHAAYVSEGGAFNVAAAHADGALNLVKKISETQYGRTYEFADRLRALEIIAKNLGMFGLTPEQSEYMIARMVDKVKAASRDTK